MTEKCSYNFTPEYRLIRGEFILPEGGRYFSFGIEAVQGGVRVDAVEDVDPDEAFVLGLAALLNKENAFLCHFREILEDAVTDRY